MSLELVMDEFVNFIYNSVITGSTQELHVVAACAGDWSDNPKAHLLVEDMHLGIPINILKSVYLELYHKTVKACSGESPSSDQPKWTFVLLCAHASTALFWNQRKVLCLRGITTLDEEDKVTNVLLHLHPKCSAIYEQRRWLLTQYGHLCHESVAKELQLCLVTATRYANNYYSWAHRQWCLSHFADEQMCRDDLHTVRVWRERNISQYSSFHHCQYLIISHLHSKLEDLICEYRDICELVKLYPGHQSLWYHRRWAVHQLSQYKECENIVREECKVESTNDRLASSYRRSLLLLCKQ